MKKHDNGELERHYIEAESADSHIFAEMRSNVLLVSGDFYRRTAEMFRERFREHHAPQDQKLRLTKNHTQAITQEYVNSICSYAPSVRVLPFNQSENQDVKAAQLNEAVWADAKAKHKLRKRFTEFCHDFVEVGEVCAYIYWDPNKGQLLGEEQALDPEGYPLYETPTGEQTIYPADPVTGEPFKPVSSGKAVFEGDICIKQIFGPNLLRDPQAESIEDSPWLIIREMVSLEDAKKLVENLPEEEREQKLSFIKEGSETTYKVFDGNRAEYVDGKGKVLLKKHFFRPCPQYPKGYYYIRTTSGILAEDELPFGIFPIVHATFNKIQTSARGRSIIKHLRPFQAEISRCASQIATHQVTLGDDKVFTQYNAKISKGLNMPGIRHYQVNGNPPTILQGRSGDQYFEYLIGITDEMYRVAKLPAINEEKPNIQDPQAMLYASLRQRKVFSLYVEKFEQFLCDFCELFLETARRYYPDSRLIKAIGRSEIVNMAEFRATSKSDYRIKTEPISEDIDTLMGKQINLQFIMQYLGKDLPDEAKGKIIRALPFVNEEEIFEELTINEDNIKSDLLALDRGEQVVPDEADDPKLYIKRLRHRMKKADFKFLPPEVQVNYKNLLEAYKILEARQAEEMLKAQAGFIPADGPLAKVDLYVPKANGKGTERAVMPTSALMWLKKRLDEQGLSQQVLQQFAPQDVIDIANQLNMPGQPPQQQPMPGPMPQPAQGDQAQLEGASAYVN